MNEKKNEKYERDACKFIFVEKTKRANNIFLKKKKKI